MREAACAGYPPATDLADYLVRKGIPFRTAHDVVGRVVRKASAEGKDLSELPLEELQSFEPHIDKDVYAVLTLEGSLSARNHLGGTAPTQAMHQVKRWEAIFSERDAIDKSKGAAEI